jgi:hypothetical protein
MHRFAALLWITCAFGQLPSWLQPGAEVRMRPEAFGGLLFKPGNDDAYVLARIRLQLRLLPRPWLKVFGQVQDARVFENDVVAKAPTYEDQFDLRQAYVELGDWEKYPVMLRVGRQELIYGEERLVGASNWANTARTFDAVRLSMHGRGMRLDLFTSSVVTFRAGEFNNHVDGDNLHGMWGVLDKLVPQAKVEPFLLWRVAPGGISEKTLGVRWPGALPHHWDYTVEMALQRGEWQKQNISAWAGHWQASHLWPEVRWTPRARVDYDYASGDRNLLDTTRGTFDVLYPTPHDKYGLADQVGWKNIHHIGVIGELKPGKQWTVQGKWHNYWLASPYDGLYNAPGALLVRDVTGRSGRRVGQELDAGFLWAPSRNWAFGGGVAHLFPGGFLKKASPGAAYTWGYLSLQLTL